MWKELPVKEIWVWGPALPLTRCVLGPLSPPLGSPVNGKATGDSAKPLPVLLLCDSVVFAKAPKTFISGGKRSIANGKVLFECTACGQTFMGKDCDSWGVGIQASKKACSPESV